jgi:hypothetical protein
MLSVLYNVWRQTDIRRSIDRPRSHTTPHEQLSCNVMRSDACPTPALCGLMRGGRQHSDATQLRHEPRGALCSHSLTLSFLPFRTSQQLGPNAVVLRADPYVRCTLHPGAAAWRRRGTVIPTLADSLTPTSHRRPYLPHTLSLPACLVLPAADGSSTYKTVSQHNPTPLPPYL